MSTVIDGSASVTINSGAILGITSGTAVASTSGTSVTVSTSIPSWVKRVTVVFQGVSTNGTSNLLVQIGSGSVQTTGYISTGTSIDQANGTGGGNATNGFLLRFGLAAQIGSGHMLLTLISGNTWVSSHTLKTATNLLSVGGGDVTLAGALDRLILTTVNGTDTFDAGSINILYE